MVYAWYKYDGIDESLPKNRVGTTAMGKILVLVLLVTAAVSIASRDVRSPGGSAWQTSTGFNGGPSSGFTRSSGGGWAGSRGELGRSASNGGWRKTSTYESSSRSRGGNRNRNPSSWSQTGYSSNGDYGRYSFGFAPGWNDRFADSTVIESLDSSNSWNEPNQGFRSNNGWLSSGW